MTAHHADEAMRTAMSDLVLDASGVGVVVFDEELRYVLVNDVAAAINGVPAKDHLGRAVDEVLPELAPTVAPVLREVLDTGTSVFGGELVGETPAEPGVERVWLVNYLSLAERTGRPGVAVVFSEVTELRRAERRLRTVMDSIFSFAGLLDRDGVLIEINRAALEVSGIEPGDVIGQPFAEAPWWSHDPTVRATMRRAVDDARAGVASRFDVTARIGDDTLLTIDFSLVPLVEGGAVTALVPSAIDITQRVESSEQAAALAQLAGQINRAVAPSEVAVAAAQGAAATVGAAFATVALLDADGRALQMVHQPGLPSEVAASWTSLPLRSGTPVQDAVLTGRSVMVADDRQRRERYPDLADVTNELGLGATIAVPLRSSDGTAIGALGVGWSIDRPPDQRLVDQLSTVADLVSQGLERTELADARVRLIRELHDQLLRPPPEVAGVDLAVTYRPATAGIGFGGDWYDVIHLPSGELALVVGDVVGHGVEAAAQMAVLLGLARTLLRQRTTLEDLPFEIDALIPETNVGYVATAAVVVLAPDRGALRYVRLGHPSLLLRRADGSVEHLDDGHHPVIGWGPSRVAVGTSSFGPGDAVVLYTDGLVERPQLDLDQGIERAARALGASAATTAAEIAEDLITLLADGPQRDDAVVAVCRHVDRASTAR